MTGQVRQREEVRLENSDQGDVQTDNSSEVRRVAPDGGRGAGGMRGGYVP